MVIQVRQSHRRYYLNYSLSDSGASSDREVVGGEAEQEDQQNPQAGRTEGSGPKRLTGEPAKEGKSLKTDTDFETLHRELEAGLQVSQRKFESAATALRTALPQLQARLEEFLSKAEFSLAELALDIARKVIHVEARTNEEVVKTAVREGLEQMKGSELTLRLYPEEADVVRAHLPELAQAAASGTFVRIVEDVEVEQGGCVVESMLGSLDLQPGVKLAQMEKLFRDTGKELAGIQE